MRRRNFSSHLLAHTTHLVLLMLAMFCFLDGIFAASDCALLVTLCFDQIVDFAGEYSTSVALVTTCHNYAEPFFWFYYFGWMIILEVLVCTAEAFLAAAWAIKRKGLVVYVI